MTETSAAWRWLQSELRGEPVPPVIAVVGLGDGQLLATLDQHAPETRVLALEPNPTHARAFVGGRLAADWRARGRLAYLAAPDFAGADEAWRIFPTPFRTPKLVVHPDLEPGPMVARTIEVLKQILVGAQANANARRQFAPRYLINSLRNIPAMLAGRPAGALADVSRTIPAIVVGAGPSLDGQYDDLRVAADRALIIATDTSLRPLLANGIAPHLVVGLDPSAINARHLLSLPECRDTWLVAESALDCRATDVFDGRTFWCRVANHHPWPWLAEQGLDATRLDVWGSVLTGAFQTACLAGCDPIVTVGADLAFTGGRPYARGTTYEFEWAWSSAFGTPVEKAWDEQTSPEARQVSVDLTGTETRTTPVMLSFRDWIVAQARKSGRRLVNATGAGVLFGDGVEQARLLDVLDRPVTLPPLSSLAPERTVVRRSALAKQLRALAGHVRKGDLSRVPVSDWTEFSGDGFDPAAVVQALEAAALAVETKRGKPTPAFNIPWSTLAASSASASVFATLPELTTRFRAALRGADPLPGASAARDLDPAERTTLLTESLAILRQIGDDVMRAPDLAAFPDPALVGSVPAGGICRWPETTRWAVELFEGLLGMAWDRPVAAREQHVHYGLADDAGRAADGPVLARETGDRSGTARRRTARLHATHACLLLAIEWLQCVSSLASSNAEALRGAIARLWLLEQRLTNVPAPTRRSAASAALLVEARADGATQTLSLPLGLSEPELARVLAGGVLTGDDGQVEIGRCDAPRLTVRVAIGAGPDEQSNSRTAARATAMVLPQVVSHDGDHGAKVVGQVEAGALCVLPFTSETVVVAPDGRIAPYQTWPRPITGALSLGAVGEVAWSNRLEDRSGGARPYLMYRPAPEAPVETVDLPFRPSTGAWWNGRLYLASLPTPNARGGIGCWAPGGEVTFEWPDLSLQAVLPAEFGLTLEACARDTGDTVLRRHAGHGWTWTPGQAPVPRPFGEHGAVSATATSGDWTAYAHPQADVIRLVSSSGATVAMRCYGPFGLAWAGSSLLVSTIDPQILIFQHLLDAIGNVDGRLDG